MHDQQLDLLVCCSSQNQPLLSHDNQFFKGPISDHESYQAEMFLPLPTILIICQRNSSLVCKILHIPQLAFAIILVSQKLVVAKR